MLKNKLYLQYESLLRKEEVVTAVYEEALALVQDAPFVHNQMIKMRVDALDKSLNWTEREDGKTQMTESDKTFGFESNILAFEQYFIDKVSLST